MTRVFVFFPELVISGYSAPRHSLLVAPLGSVVATFNQMWRCVSLWWYLRLFAGGFLRDWRQYIKTTCGIHLCEDFIELVFSVFCDLTCNICGSFHQYNMQFVLQIVVVCCFAYFPSQCQAFRGWSLSLLVNVVKSTLFVCPKSQICPRVLYNLYRIHHTPYKLPFWRGESITVMINWLLN